MPSPRYILIVLLGIIGSSAITSGQESPVFINPNVVIIPEFEGWGTSLAWWPDVLGHMAEEVIEEVTTALFSPDKLNLNIVRYTIGGTTPWNHTCGPYRTGAATETFLDGPDFDYDWTRDPRQRDILKRAKVLGVDTFEAFSNSPPQWMTITGCSKGNDLGGLLHANFASDKAEAFADYATDVLIHFRDVEEIEFQTYAPFNEPFGLAGLGGWFGTNSGQEGCNMARSVMADVLKAVDAALKAKGLTSVTIAAADETQINTETSTQNYFRENGVSDLVSKVNVHGYWDVAGNRRDLLFMGCNKDGHKLWMDEMGWEETPPTDMTQGFHIVNRILVDLKKMLPSAWVYWQAVEGYTQWGVISIPYDNPGATLDDIKYNSGYFSFMQFSRYIKKGYNILSVNDDNVLAAIGGTNLVIVIVNSEDVVEQKRLSLTMFKSFGAITATRTSPTEQNADIPGPAWDGTQLTYEATPHSITTIEIADTEFDVTANLLSNGDFETALAPWTLELGTTGGIETESVWRGTSTGYLDSTASEIQISQTVKAPKTGIFFLTAWCSAEAAAGAKLVVSAGGVKVKELSVKGGVGFDSYAISFPANGDEDIKFSFYSPKGDAKSYIDDVSLFHV